MSAPTSIRASHREVIYKAAEALIGVLGIFGIVLAPELTEALLQLVTAITGVLALDIARRHVPPTDTPET